MRPRQADAAQALRRACRGRGSSALLDEAATAADRLGVRAARRRQDDARRELPRSARAAPSLVPGRHRATATRRRSSTTCGWRRCSSCGKKAAGAAALQPEPQQDIARFARTYFREFFSVLPRPTRDRARQLPRSAHDAASARRLRARARGSSGRHHASSSISRSDPPHGVRAARRRAAGSRASSRPRLRCTPEEAEAMLGGSDLDERGAARITRQSDGWVAALVLLREHLSRAGRSARRVDRRRQGRDLPVFRRRDLQSAREPENQRVLMLTAISPSITPGRGGGADRRRRSAAPPRLPLSPASLHRPPPRHAHDLSLPRAVSRIPARGGEHAPVARRSGARPPRAPPSS